ncbi:hypothetical protein D3C72_1860590 [compost metagenome]
MKFQAQVVERNESGDWYLALVRWAMVAIFIWFGIQKFTSYAADAIAQLISHSPFMSWLTVFGVIGEARVIGTIGFITAALLIIGARRHCLQLWISVMAKKRSRIGGHVHGTSRAVDIVEPGHREGGAN